MLLDTKVTPSYLWKTLHEKGKSGLASSFGEEQLARIDTENFSNFAVATAHREYARITEVTAKAAAERSLLWRSAKKYTLRAITTVLNHFPLGSDEQQAQLRGNYWQHDSSQESAQMICLRDVWQLTKFLIAISPQTELALYAQGIRKLLETLIDSEPNGKRNGLIFLAEEAEYALAKQSYNEYAEDFGPRAQDTTEPMESITTAARFFSRAFFNKDKEQAVTCAKDLRVLFSKHNHSRFVITEIVKNLAKVLLSLPITERNAGWQNKTNDDSEMQQHIKQLLKLTFVGLGNDRVEKIGPAQPAQVPTQPQ